MGAFLIFCLVSTSEWNCGLRRRIRQSSDMSVSISLIKLWSDVSQWQYVRVGHLVAEGRQAMIESEQERRSTTIGFQ